MSCCPSPSCPNRAAIIGGGAIGLEFASLLSDLGSEVTVLEALPRILVGADDDVVKMLTRAFKKRKIEIRTGVSVSGAAAAPATGWSLRSTAMTPSAWTR